jgi:hypothetical protein
MPKLIDSIEMGEQRLDMLATPTTVQEEALELLQVRASAKGAESMRIQFKRRASITIAKRISTAPIRRATKGVVLSS